MNGSVLFFYHFKSKSLPINLGVNTVIVLNLPGHAWDTRPFMARFMPSEVYGEIKTVECRCTFVDEVLDEVR